MSDQDNNQPSFAIQRIYLKDLSLELPNAPQILLEQGQPQIDVQLNLHAEPVVEGIYEVAVTATVTTKVKDKTLFLVEAKQAGIFEIRHVPEEQMQGIIDTEKKGGDRKMDLFSFSENVTRGKTFPVRYRPL